MSTAGNTDSKFYAYEAGKRAIESHLNRMGWRGTISMTKDLGFYTIRYKVPKNLTVGIYLWGKVSILSEHVRQQLENELIERKVKIIWNYDLKEPVDYIILIYRGVISLTPQGISTLLGSCARKGIAMTGGRVVRQNRVEHCGYWKEEEQYLARYQNLPIPYKGYYHRAFLPVEVDALGREVVILDYHEFQKAGGSKKHLESSKAWQKLSNLLQEEQQRVIVVPQVTAKVKELNSMSWRREHV